ncbi:YoaK family protein [Arthrobacter cryoconiti]|uniref:YoaK family protein n=1 Tax=Arthrobacter cryoconiti TaxID=748907 RepID=A0ABV8QZI9_9MICC|nr:YoaK family protein [Arthrobacter cryoconiti]MCC9068643.1 DUF1275 domain-containing protein [Arthrobacter cryoconiti]
MRRIRSLRTDRIHLILMLALTFSTGVVDAVGYLGLDRVFTGNMTGNVVILGMALLGDTGLPILRPVLALLFFMLGAALAGRALRHAHPGWSHRTSMAFFTVGLGLGVLALVVGLSVDPVPELTGSVVTSGMATMMGIQAAAARKLKVVDVTTVVVTSTITAFASESKLAGGDGKYWARRLLAIILILTGAVVGAAALHIALWLGLAVSAVLTIAVVTLGHSRYKQDQRIIEQETLELTGL